MDELLGLHLNLPIQQAEHDNEIKPNRIYLRPPKKEMTIRERRLLLSDKQRVTGLILPIDQFFASLARDVGPDAVGIILSGRGVDGSRGALEIKKMGGHVFESLHAGEILRLMIEDGNPLESSPDTLGRLKASNKELNRRYEELAASNKTLQSRNDELHSANEELNTANAELQRKIGELWELNVTDRKQAEEEIRTAARRREQFLAMLSHELRNPLAAVVNAAMVMQAPNVKSESIEKARQIIGRQSRHMARLLDDLLDVSRITRGAIELRKEDIDLREVVRTAIEALTPVLEEHNAQLITDLPIDLPIRADAARMQQVVVNLLSNAARYSPPGSPIHLSATTNADSIVLSVQDHGRGIPSSMISEIFELFVQHGQGLERSRGGLGIGLTFVRQIVELHGGHVEAHSEGIDKGSEFIVTLPRQSSVRIHPQPEPQQLPDVQRVLIVEDQDDSREMLRVLLESMGHIVLERADGGTGLAAIQREHPDVALIDIGLPVMSGYEVARRVRENQLLDDVVLIALTGYGRDSDVNTAYTAGFDAHVTKPADSRVIDEMLTRKFQRRKAS